MIDWTRIQDPYIVLGVESDLRRNVDDGTAAMSSRRSRRFRDMTRLINAQARHAGAQARQAEAENVRAHLEVEERRRLDAIAHQERFVRVLDEQHAHKEVRVFNYLRLITEGLSHQEWHVP
jgi:hypothetical protein